MKELLGDIGAVEQIGKKTILRAILGSRLDLAILNWTDNGFINGAGGISLIGLARVFFRLLGFKIAAKKIVFVRHNLFPHAALSTERSRATKLVNFYERFFDIVWVHSGHLGTKKRRYIPHPLYVDEAAELESDHDEFNLPASYFVIFGRILPYKKIESLLEVLPDNLNLVVCGPSPDAEYLARLQSHARNNVTFIARFLPEQVATRVVKKAQGLVICNSEDDMIVSGSLIFGLSKGVRTFTLRSGFTSWFSEQTKGRMIIDAKNLVELVSNMSSLSAAPIAEDVCAARAHFSDEACKLHIRNTLALIGFRTT